MKTEIQLHRLYRARNGCVIEITGKSDHPQALRPYLGTVREVSESAARTTAAGEKLYYTAAGYESAACGVAQHHWPHDLVEDITPPAP